MGSLRGFPVTPVRATSGGEDTNGHSCTVPRAAGKGGLRDPQGSSKMLLGRGGDEDSSQLQSNTCKMRKSLVKIDFEKWARKIS